MRSTRTPLSLNAVMTLLEAHPDFLPMVQQAIREENDRIARGDLTEEERATFQAARVLGDPARQRIERITTDIFLQSSKP